ncbi:uncharacterized protein V1513DRAFT_381497, partial [Lipomyces chichibuensis]|uniref:uncharacterized protein n=1 Tax=Lipomyces chichibuensis TaxID=1546026 RepID=UPI003343C29B
NFPKPTGDPNCPSDVKRAKDLNRIINESLEMVGLDVEDVLHLAEETDTAADDEGQEDNGPRPSSGSPRLSSVPPISKASVARADHLRSNKGNKRDLTESLTSYLDVERREDYKVVPIAARRAARRSTTITGGV